MLAFNQSSTQNYKGALILFNLVLRLRHNSLNKRVQTDLKEEMIRIFNSNIRYRRCIYKFKVNAYNIIILWFVAVLFTHLYRWLKSVCRLKVCCLTYTGIKTVRPIFTTDMNGIFILNCCNFLFLVFCLF